MFKEFTLKEILAYIAGAVDAPEGVQVKWTDGARDGFTPLWVSGILTRLDGAPVGLISIRPQVNEWGDGPEARAWVRTPQGLRRIALPYVGAWQWPLEAIAETERPLEQRGRKVPVPHRPKPQTTRRRRAVRRKVVRAE